MTYEQSHAVSEIEKIYSSMYILFVTGWMSYCDLSRKIFRDFKDGLNYSTESIVIKVYFMKKGNISLQTLSVRFNHYR